MRYHPMHRENRVRRGGPVRGKGRRSGMGTGLRDTAPRSREDVRENDGGCSRAGLGHPPSSLSFVTSPCISVLNRATTIQTVAHPKGTVVFVWSNPMSGEIDPPLALARAVVRQAARTGGTAPGARCDCAERRCGLPTAGCMPYPVPAVSEPIPPISLPFVTHSAAEHFFRVMQPHVRWEFGRGQPDEERRSCRSP